MKRSTLIVGASLSVVLLTVSACGGAAGESGGSGDGAVQLVFRQFDPADQIEGLVTAVDVWNSENPDVQVQMETISPNNPQQFAREANSGSGPDVVHLALADVAFLAEPNVLLPVDDLLVSDPLDGADDLLATEMTVIDDTTWAVPWTADTMALVYRPDILADAGLEDTPETWEDLKTASAAIAESTDGATSGFCFPASGQQPAAQWFAINYYLWNHDQYFMDNSGGQWAPAVSEEFLADAMDYFNEFFAEGYTPTSFQAITDYADPAIASGLDTGSCAMAYMPPAAFRSISSQTDAELLTAPMPGGLKDGSSHLGGRALGINANTDHPEEAWRFIKYLMSADTFETYSQYPASAKTLTEMEVPENETGFTDQLPHSVPFYRHMGAPLTNASLQELVNQHFSAVYSGQSDSQEAARALLEAIERGLQG